MANCVFKTRLSKDILLVHCIHRKTWNFHRRKIVWNRPVEIASLTPWYSRFPRICLHSEAFRKVLNIFTFSISGQLVPVFCVDLAVFFVFFFPYQISGWLKSTMRTSACDPESIFSCLWKTSPNSSYWSGGL